MNASEKASKECKEVRQQDGAGHACRDKEGTGRNEQPERERLVHTTVKATAEGSREKGKEEYKERPRGQSVDEDEDEEEDCRLAREIAQTARPAAVAKKAGASASYPPHPRTHADTHARTSRRATHLVECSECHSITGIDVKTLSASALARRAGGEGGRTAGGKIDGGGGESPLFLT